MSKAEPQFLPFPEPMAEELRRLEQAKMHIVAGFLYATGFKDKSIRVAPDLSGLEVSDVPAAAAQPISPTALQSQYPTLRPLPGTIVRPIHSEASISL